MHGTHEQGQFAIDDEDYAVRGALVLRQGVTSWPAPLPPAAAPTAAKPAPVKLPPTPEELAAKHGRPVAALAEEETAQENDADGASEAAPTRKRLDG